EPPHGVPEFREGGVEKLVAAVLGDPEVTGDHIDRLLVAQVAEDDLELPFFQASEQVGEKIRILDTLFDVWDSLGTVQTVRRLAPPPDGGAAQVALDGAKDDGRELGLDRP